MKLGSPMLFFRLLFIGSGFLCMVLTPAYAATSKSMESTSEEEMISREEHPINDKRYIAALAKNGRLPKFQANQKKDGNDQNMDEDIPRNLAFNVPQSFIEDKRHIGALLKSRGKPDFSRFVGGPGEISRRAIYSDMELSGLGNADKRNVATLARLGRLNAVRYARFQPQYSGKRWTPMLNEELNDGFSPKGENEIVEGEEDCEDSKESDSENSEDNYTHPNWMQSQQKRYVAALARSGRLPTWHPQRMWGGGKRDTPKAYWMKYRSGARSLDDKRQNTIDEVPRFIQLKNKRCKKSSDAIEEEKRNLAMLARKGVLSSLPYASA